MKWQHKPSYEPRFIIMNGAKSLIYCQCEEEPRINLLSIVYNCPSCVTSNLNTAEVKSIWFQVINETFRPVVYSKHAKDLQCDIY